PMWAGCSWRKRPKAAMCSRSGFAGTTRLPAAWRASVKAAVSRFTAGDNASGLQRIVLNPPQIVFDPPQIVFHLQQVIFDLPRIVVELHRMVAEVQRNVSDPYRIVV